MNLPTQGYWTQEAIPSTGCQTVKEWASRSNAEKLRWSLLPMASLEDVVRVLEMGAKKYGDYNWQKGFADPNCCYDSAMRHLVAMGKGEWRDTESNLPHAAHVATNMLFELHLRDKAGLYVKV